MDNEFNLSTNDEKLERVEKSILKLRKKVEVANKLDMLMKNDDFVDIILNQLLNNNLQILANKIISTESSDEITEALAKIESIKLVKTMLNDMVREYNSYKSALAEDEKYRIELLNEVND